MGNSHSQHHQIPTHQWTHSYPRPKYGQPQVKVLPERIPPLRLRTTDNGAILQNGGTISCKKQSVQEERAYRPRSSSAHRPPKLDEITLDKTRFGSEPDLRFHLKEARDQFNDNAVRQRISRSRKKYKAPPAPQNGLSCGLENSSPDLNGWDGNPKDCNTGPGRKARLFKTRAETHKKNAGATKKMESVDPEISRSSETFNVSRKQRQEKLPQSTNEEKGRNELIEKVGLRRSVSHEVISTKKSLATPEFQAELLEAAQRLRSSMGGTRQISAVGKVINTKAQIEHLDKEEVHLSRNADISKENNFKANSKIIQSQQHEELSSKCCRNGKSARSKQEKFQSSYPEPVRDKFERDVPSKKFYFGMEESSSGIAPVNNCLSTNNVDKTNAEHRVTAVEKSKNLMNLYKSVAEESQDWEDSIDKFAANFQKSQIALVNGNTTSCSSSFVSDPDEDVGGGIALQLRPTLPKKQLEIPRFSPTAAWRLLSSIETNCSQSPSSGDRDDTSLLLEDRIHPPVPQQALRSSHDKSGDSGISGDASPGGCHESSSEIAVTSAKAMATQNPKNILMAWTPQQDLEEESSSDDLESPLNSSKNIVSNIPGAKFSPRGQLFLSRDQSFTMSVPREERMYIYAENGDPKDRCNLESVARLNSLKKLKVALGSSKREVLDENTSQNDNWVLSRSVPSSLNNSHVAVTRSISNPSSPEQDDENTHQVSIKYPSYSYLANGGRMMYLPEYHSRMSPDVLGKRPRNNVCNGFLSKSCENIMHAEMKQIVRSRTPSPVFIQSHDDAKLHSERCKTNQKKKKFTFQSTVRLIENRRIAERLSREAELKENQRLSEVEAMRKVEEEFQKKRAREKANIRQQLRLFNLEEKNYSSLPSCDWEENRGDPEGAPSSLPPPGTQTSQRKFSANKKTSNSGETNKFATTTQILSEFREPMREYRDYRHPRYHEPQELPLENNKRSVVEHPKMVYDMPKSTAVYVSAPINSSTQNQIKDESRVGLSTPRLSSSDNYRKDFAHGALATGGRSLNSSDSEISQSHGRPAPHHGISHRFNAVHRSRSASPESISPSDSPLQGLDSMENSPRSRSTSPIKIIITQKSRSMSPNKSSNDINDFSTHGEQSAASPKKFSTTLERKLSNPNKYRSSNNEYQAMSMDRKHEKQSEMAKNGTNSLVRLGLPSLQPFDKSEKSFRPVNFNPVVNKLAQTVN